MTSLAKIEANRRNGRLSKGPKTEAGKDTSRRNALRDGFTAQKLFTSSENEEDFKLFLAGMIEALQPADADEDELVNGIGMCRWRLRRIFRAEAALLDGGNEDDAYIVKMASLRCLGDREAKILRTMNMLERRLKERQSERRRNENDKARGTQSESDSKTVSETSTPPPPRSKAGRLTMGAANPGSGPEGRKPNPAAPPTNDILRKDPELPLDAPSDENGKTNPPPECPTEGPKSVSVTPAGSGAEDSGSTRATAPQPTAATTVSSPVVSPSPILSQAAILQRGISFNSPPRR